MTENQPQQPPNQPGDNVQGAGSPSGNTPWHGATPSFGSTPNDGTQPLPTTGSGKHSQQQYGQGGYGGGGQQYGMSGAL